MGSRDLVLPRAIPLSNNKPSIVSTSVEVDIAGAGTGGGATEALIVRVRAAAVREIAFMRLPCVNECPSIIDVQSDGGADEYTRKSLE